MSIILGNIKYKIIKIIGEDGLGKIFQVENELNNKYYSIKEIIIKDEMKHKIKVIKEKVDILCKLNFENLIKYYNSYIEKDKLYILMEYYNEQNLKDFINKNNNKLIEENILYNIIKQICIGIKETYNKNIIHGDIKTENIFMDEKMNIKIGYFDISKYFGENKEYANKLNKKENLYYMAPEIIMKGIYNEKSDMYSLGCIIYELFNLSKYYEDNFKHEIKTIDSNIYNYKWQEIINSLLQIDYNKRMNINQIYDIILNGMNIKELKNEIKNINIENNQNNNKNIIIDEININKDNTNKVIQNENLIIENNKLNKLSISNNFVNLNNPYFSIKLKDEFKKDPLIGLQNVGGPNYMNAILQCFSHIEQLTNYFKYNNEIENIIEKNKTSLTSYYKFLIENLWPSINNNNKYIDKNYIGQYENNNYFIPLKFKKKLLEMNPQFEDKCDNDAKNIVMLIMLTLHEELNEKKIFKANVRQNKNPTNINESRSYFFKNFFRENKSIISELFFGVTHNVFKCLKCNILKHSFFCFDFLLFRLEEVRKYKLELVKNQNMMFMNQNNFNAQFQQNLIKINSLENKNVNIYDCFEYYQKIEYFSGKDSFYCDICKTEYSCNYAEFIYSLPNVLILILNRGLGNLYFVKLEYYTELYLTNFVEAKQNNEIIIYDLIGVIIGLSSDHIHFIAICKSPIDGLWYRYNDSFVSQVHDFKIDILNYSMPYVLLYQRRE